MRKLLYGYFLPFTGLLFICCLISCASDTSKTESAASVSSAPDSVVQQTLKELTYKEDEMELKNDFAALDTLLSKDLIISWPNGMLFNRDSLYDMLKKRGPDTAGVIVPEYADFKVNVYDKAAVTNYLVTFHSKDSAGKITSDKFRNTVTWIKKDNHWEAVAAGVSYIEPPKIKK